MGERKAISKKIRFEVFKRDSFKCQYCGRGSPEVLLHVDHIQPVKHGGTNDLLNLITSCSDCNLGKGSVKLDDATSIEKQRKQLEELQEKREQLEMMMQWREELETMRDDTLNFAANYYSKRFNSCLTEYGREVLQHELEQFGLQLVLDAMDITWRRGSISPQDRLRYMAGICWNKKRGL